MAEGFEIARAYVAVDPDTAGFGAKAKSELDAETRDLTATIPLKADGTRASATIDEIRAKLDRLKADSPSPKVTVQIAEAEARAEQIQARMDRLNAVVARPQVTPEMAKAYEELDALQAELERLNSERVTPTAQLKIDEAEAKVDELNAILDRLESRDVEIRVKASADLLAAQAQLDKLNLSMDEVAAKSDLVGKQAADAGSKAGGLFSHGLIASAIAVGLPLAPAAGVLMGTSMVAGLAGALIAEDPQLKSAVTSMFTGVKDVLVSELAPIAAELLPTIRSLGTEFEGLGPEIAGAFQAGLPGIRDLLNGLEQAVSQFLPGFTAGLHEMQPAAAELGQTLGLLGKTLGDTFQALGADGGAKASVDILNTLLQVVDTLLPPIARLAGSIASDLDPALHAILPPVAAIVAGMADVASAFARVDPLVVDAGIAYLALRGPIGTVSGLVKDAVGAWEGLAAAQTAEAAASEEAAGASSAGWLTSMVGTIKEAVAAYQGLGVAEEATTAEVAATGAAAEGAVAGVGGLGAALGVLGAAVPPAALIGGAAIAIGLLGAVALKDTPSLSGLIGKMKEADQASGYNVAGYQKLASQMSLTGSGAVKLNKDIQDTASGFEKGRYGSEAYVQAQGQVSSAQQQASQSARNLQSGLGQVEQALGITQSQAIQTAQAAGVSASAFTKGGQSAQDAANKTIAYAEAGDQAASSASKLAVEEGILGSATASTTTKVTALNNAYAALVNPQLNLMNDTVSFKQDQTSLATALEASHGKLGTYNAATQAATTATTAAAAGALKLSADILTQTGSAQRAAGPLEALVGELEKAGASGGGAAKLIAELNAQIAALHSKTVDIRIITQAIGQGAGGTGGFGHGQKTAGFATGGVIPGQDTGRDSVLIAARPEEGILVPEAVRGIGGKPAIDALNRKYGGAVARSSGSSGLQHFAGGGLVSSVQAIGADTFNINVSIPPWYSGQGGDPARGGTLGPGRLSGAEEALAKSLTPSALKAMESAGKSLVHAFSDGSLKTLSQIKSEASQAIDAIRKYYSGAAQTTLVGAVKKQTAALEKLATRSQEIAAKISSMKAFASSTASNLSSFSDLSSLTAPKSGETATQIGQGIKAQLNQDLKELHNFFGIIGQAKKAGLDKTFIEQAIALGPIDGYTYLKAALSGGKSLIDTINKDEKAIGAEDKLIGRRAADIQYGQSISKGFLSGLDKEKAKLDKEMKRLGDEIAEELAKAFHIPKADLPKAVRTAGHAKKPAHHDAGGGKKHVIKGRAPQDENIKITINYNGKKPSAEDQAAAMRKLASAIGSVG